MKTYNEALMDQARAILRGIDVTDFDVFPDVEGSLVPCRVWVERVGLSHSYHGDTDALGALLGDDVAFMLTDWLPSTDSGWLHFRIAVELPTYPIAATVTTASINHQTGNDQDIVELYAVCSVRDAQELVDKHLGGTTISAWRTDVVLRQCQHREGTTIMKVGRWGVFQLCKDRKEAIEWVGVALSRNTGDHRKVIATDEVQVAIAASQARDLKINEVQEAKLAYELAYAVEKARRAKSNRTFKRMLDGKGKASKQVAAAWQEWITGVMARGRGSLDRLQADPGFMELYLKAMELPGVVEKRMAMSACMKKGDEILG